MKQAPTGLVSCCNSCLECFMSIFLSSHLFPLSFFNSHPSNRVSYSHLTSLRSSPIRAPPCLISGLPKSTSIPPPPFRKRESSIFVQLSNHHSKTGPFEYQTCPVFRWSLYFIHVLSGTLVQAKNVSVGRRRWSESDQI